MKLESKAAEMQTMIESAQAQTQTLQAALDDAEKAIRRGKRVKQQVCVDVCVGVARQPHSFLLCGRLLVGVLGAREQEAEETVDCQPRHSEGGNTPLYTVPTRRCCCSANRHRMASRKSDWRASSSS